MWFLSKMPYITETKTINLASNLRNWRYWYKYYTRLLSIMKRYWSNNKSNNTTLYRCTVYLFWAKFKSCNQHVQLVSKTQIYMYWNLITDTSNTTSAFKLPGVYSLNIPHSINDCYYHLYEAQQAKRDVRTSWQ